MANCLKRFWFEFDFPQPRLSHYGYIPKDGCCGITAYNYDDALKILRLYMLRENEVPVFSRVIENVDVSDLLNESVNRNLGVTVWRGVWYPAYNLRQDTNAER